MNIYSMMYKPRKPKKIEQRKAYIVGGGIAGLAAAAFLVDDASMPGENITILEKSSDVGGCCDGAKSEHGYLCRGEREMEPYMECLWYLYSKIPSIENEGRSVLDDIVEFNRDEPITQSAGFYSIRARYGAIYIINSHQRTRQICSIFFIVLNQNLKIKKSKTSLISHSLSLLCGYASTAAFPLKDITVHSK